MSRVANASEFGLRSGFVLRLGTHILSSNIHSINLLRMAKVYGHGGQTLYNIPMLPF
jgi:hypothetical protein